MKKCTKCKKEKSVNDFNFKIKAIKLRQYQCKECTRTLVRSHYRRNRNYYLKKAQKHNLVNRLEAQNYIRNYLSRHSCIDCGESDITVLEFDHIKDKFKAVSSLMRGRYSLHKIQEEIKKCDVRCANCHRKKTSKQFGWFKKTKVNVPVA